MYVWRNTEARSRNSFYRGKSINIIYFVLCVCVCARAWVHACACMHMRGYVFGCPAAWVCACACTRVVLLMQHETRMRHIVICGVFGSTIFFDITSLTARFSNKIGEHKVCVLTFHTKFIWNISYSKKNLARYCHKYAVFTWCTCYSWRTLIKPEFSRRILEETQI
jgi:hypothetical protein